ncbi:transcription factor MYB93-like [Oryza brachyantha]|uniref:Uncharacterized protein n=1 Tax=Oryza brachyantha TaxID=4533 RepID=J3MCI8_ORYBR|nr:transcription factor MYB93-like [Oryza brachyantha]
MGRSPCCDENGLKKGPWTPEEDEKLMGYIQKHGHGSWRVLPKLAGLNRCGKSCRLRWTNYLKPDIKRGSFSREEEQTILQLHSILGNKWSAIAKHLPGRTDNEIKNFWNTHLRKKLIKMGIDPMTHRPRTDLIQSLPQLIALASLRQIIEQRPWDGHIEGLQTVAVQAAKLEYMQSLLHSAVSIVTSPTNSSNRLNTCTTELEQTNLLSPPQVPSSSVHELAGQVPHSHMPSTSFDQQIGKTNLFSNNIMNGNEWCSIEAENSSQKSLLVPENSLPPLTDMPVPNFCNTISTPNCDGSNSILLPSWSEILLDEELMDEFA